MNMLEIKNRVVEIIANQLGIEKIISVQNIFDYMESTLQAA